MADRLRRPGITQVGRVTATCTGELVMTDWTFTECSTGCRCHRHPQTGRLALLEDGQGKWLGLVSWRRGGCGCCSPWTADELWAVLEDLAAAAILPTAPI